MRTGWLVAVVLVTSATVSAGADLTIRVTDENRNPIWSRLEVRNAEGKMFQAEGAILDKRSDRRVSGGPDYYPGSFVVNGECSLTIPPGSYLVIAEHGLEYVRVKREIEVAAEEHASLGLQLRPWIRMRERGWYSADLHVHRPLDQLKPLALAEDVNLTVATTMWNQRSFWADRPPPADPVLRASDSHLVTIMNAEDERGGGAWMLMGLPAPMSLKTEGRWYPPGIRFVEQARARKKKGALFPWFEIEKLIWWEAPVMMALATPDSAGMLHNHFNQYRVLDNEAWGRPRDTSKFPGREGFTQYCLQLFYRYWNLGFRTPPTAGSASGVLPNPVGYNRVYVPIGGKFTPESWFAALRKGKSLVTNGPILFFDAKLAGDKIRTTLEARAREPIGRVEIVADGKVVDSYEPEPSTTTLKRNFTLDRGRHSWIAARCFLSTDVTVRFAHTSPVFLRDAAASCADDARYFIDWIDRLIALTTPDRFETVAQRNEVLQLYRRARRFYAAKLKTCPE